MTAPVEQGHGRGVLDLIAVLEFGITVVLGVVLFFLKAHELGEITWIFGGVLVLHRATLLQTFQKMFQISQQDLDRKLSRYNGLAEIVDINQGLRQQSLRELNDLFFRIADPEFESIRERIVSEAKVELALLADQKRSKSLLTGEYYNWLLPMIVGASAGSNIWAVSMMLDCEFDDSPEETAWLAFHLEAIARGVVVDRIFVVSEANQGDLSSIPAVAAQIQAAGGDHIRTVSRERLEKVDPELLIRLGDGLIAFDRRVVLIDEHSESGKARGYVSKNAEKIRRCRSDFEGLSRMSSECILGC